ncbi:hypothetical protein AMTRI_Chr13g125280 [Amborella trichopoda]|uniref:Uncharacterized protein n=1 Tax=Amborella trichopoda TaxID=13333 RepID=U5CWD3_AMBTC|nr:uncharacterized protein LOC18445976 [Amborella trichopoda]XP_020530185.1 uncharacterized protein LOC18445976 [Amborella trichopoda]ERN17631.1 hypothetical protein AMTR_s00059p00175070 [Amborella trichopoda]|eukprot:XP_006856164.1 uncharacterized protein LOC18445976 [Amborella trichopoda]
MGLCCSCEAPMISTAKLILLDGKLQEFAGPVKVSHVLQHNPSCFICNSDNMGFDDFISAVSSDDELQPGQLYFALPLSKLQKPLKASEMAALAVKASCALKKTARDRQIRINPVCFPVENGRNLCFQANFLVENGPKISSCVGGLERERRRRPNACYRPSFKDRLGAIEEGCTLH